MLTLFGVCLFSAAGSWDWKRGWVALGICFLAEFMVNGFLVFFAPNTLNERGAGHTGVKRFDIAFAVLYLVLSLSLAAVVGFDCVRFGWSSFSWTTLYVGIVLMVATTFIGTWAMIENEHFEQFVRIQSERDHRVVMTGPYRLVRHPGYLAAIMGAISGPLLFGSIWSIIPTFFMIVLFIWRTSREDRTLQKELDGYSQFMKETPHRLIPFVW